MATHIGIGFSRELDTSYAAREAALEAKTQAKQENIDLVIVFITIHYNALEALRIIRQFLGNAKVIGCSTAGIILSNSIEMHGISVLVINSQDLKFGIGCAENIAGQDLKIAGSELARNAVMDFGKHHRTAFLLFSDGLLRNTLQLINGIQGILGSVFPIMGARASDNFRYKETFQYFQDQVMSNSAVGLLLGGDRVSVGIGSKHGWKPLGKPRIASKTKGEIINKIDGKRASSIYEEYFDSSIEELKSTSLAQTASLYPLGVYVEDEDEYLLRNALEVSGDGSIMCQGEVPSGSELHVMIGNKDLCLEATKKAALELKARLSNKQPKLIIVLESMSRYKLLKRSAIKEIQIIKETLGTTVPIIGIYTLGEIAPSISLNHVCEVNLLNQTITILGIA